MKTLTRILALALTVSLAWLFVRFGMYFQSVDCGDGGFGCLFPPALLFVLVGRVLQPILSPLPDAVLTATLSIKGFLPFITAALVAKYLLVALLAIIPFLVAHFIAKRIKGKENSRTYRRISWVVYGVFVLFFVISLSILRYRADIPRVTRHIDIIKSTCQAPAECFEEFKRFEETIDRNGLRFPDFDIEFTLRDKKVTLSPEEYERYCNLKNDIYYQNECRIRFNLFNPVDTELSDCLAQATAYGGGEREARETVTEHCVNNVVSFELIDIETLRPFLKNITYNDSRGVERKRYEFASDTTYKETYSLLSLNNTYLGVQQSVSDEQFVTSCHISFSQWTPRVYEIFDSGTWPRPEPIAKDVATHLGFTTNEAALLDREKINVGGQSAWIEHFNRLGYAHSDYYRIGFLLKDTFVLVTHSADPDKHNTAETRNCIISNAELIVRSQSPQ